MRLCVTGKFVGAPNYFLFCLCSLFLPCPHFIELAASFPTVAVHLSSTQLMHWNLGYNSFLGLPLASHQPVNSKTIDPATVTVTNLKILGVLHL